MRNRQQKAAGRQRFIFPVSRLPVLLGVYTHTHTHTHPPTHPPTHTHTHTHTLLLNLGRNVNQSNNGDLSSAQSFPQPHPTSASSFCSQKKREPWVGIVKMPNYCRNLNRTPASVSINVIHVTLIRPAVLHCYNAALKSCWRCVWGQ